MEGSFSCLASVKDERGFPLTSTAHEQELRLVYNIKGFSVFADVG